MFGKMRGRCFSLRQTIPFLTLCASALTAAGGSETNLLLNPYFEFHSFSNHREGKANNFSSNNAACWNTGAWGDITVMREAHADPAVRPPYSVHNMVSIAPGKKITQFFTLPEAGLAHGDKISLLIDGWQDKPNALKASVKILKLDSEDGSWTPSEVGCTDKRTFPKHSRGELVSAKSCEAVSDKTGPVELKINGAEIPGKFTNDKDSHSGDINSIAVSVELENQSADGKVWVWAPCLAKTDTAMKDLPPSRPMPEYYRSIPATIQKLWKGETVHIMIMGSSIDRGSANPPMYPYNEDPGSPDFKKPLADRNFDGSKVSRPDLDGHFGWWNHYFSYGGRLKLELMRKFNLPANKICLTFMACDGSCVGEAHSGLKDYFSMALPPSANMTGHKDGAKWDELFPELFKRPQGPGPDLVIFGSGANEKTDTPDEAAVFEGMIRWIQRHNPASEFLFCQFQNNGGYTPNPGDMMALSLRYQIPFIDYGKVGDDVTRWCSKLALVPSDGHPQAASHYIWFKQIEKAFECWDPVMPGIAQLRLPGRAHKNTYGWEGDMLTFDDKSPRIKGAKFIFEDTALNCWGNVAESAKPEAFVDGTKAAGQLRRGLPKRDIRNSFFRVGNCSLGDRHILEITGQDSALTAVDAKICPDRRFYAADNKLWKNAPAVSAFKSEWGAPYGDKQIVLKPDESAEIDVVCTDISAAYADTPAGGSLSVSVDGVEKLAQPANIPFTDQEKNNHFMENRKGVLGLGFGLHRVKISAKGAPVVFLGLFTYDSRPNRSMERRLTGFASPGETVEFSLPFKARPVIGCGGGLAVKPDDISREKAVFSGDKQGFFEAIGE
jgi:hypothetical protein